MRPFIFRLPEFLGRIPDWVPLFGGTQLGGRPIFSYGVMLGLSFLLGWLLAFFFIDRLGYERRRTLHLGIAALVGTLIGARLLYFIASAPGQFSLAAFFQFQKGGLVAYGGFIGGLGASALLALWTRSEWWGRADAVAPVLLLGTGITRLGCFLYGCDFGRATESAFSLQFPRWSSPATGAWIPGGAPASLQHIKEGLIEASACCSASVYPTQLLLSLKGFVGFALVMMVLPYRRFRGQVLLVFLLYYGTVRFLVEFLRGDKIRGTSTLGLPLSTSQFVSACIVLGAIPLWVFLQRREAKNVSCEAKKSC